MSSIIGRTSPRCRIVRYSAPPPDEHLRQRDRPLTVPRNDHDRVVGFHGTGLARFRGRQGQSLCDATQVEHVGGLLELIGAPGDRIEVVEEQPFFAVIRKGQPGNEAIAAVQGRDRRDDVR
jgi:hypothetical protein